ncbi:2-oxoglutarate receptor 1 [Rhinatrema bivittatum]|uniref:2-oxoglutarate receptor 1 n=1 Tax=Rhinatrema bivittatum TaxID=194408 RepID=UPI00112D696E|nr:2-oxoglutarate receptor 1 [Rhinatrema bivittatum]
MNTKMKDLMNSTTWQNSTRSENCTDLDASLTKYYLPTMYSIIFLVGFPGNLFAITLYIFKIRPWRTSTIIMVNLAITDLFYLTSLPFLVYYYSNQESWDLGDFMCKFIRFSFNFNLYSSILFLTCFSIFRYFAVVHPMKFQYIHKKKWAVVACIAVWIIALIAVIPMNLMIDFTKAEGISSCLDFASSMQLDTIRWYNLLLTIIGFFLPLVVVTLCYTWIMYSLASGPYTHDSYKKKARKLIVILLVVFYVCFLPFHILRLARIEARQSLVACHTASNINAAYIISRPIAVLNTLGNLLLYIAIGDNFQQAILSVFKCTSPNYDQQTGSNNTDVINRT